MTYPSYHISKLAPGEHDLGAFDCGEQTYNDWLAKSALGAISAGTCAVYVLVSDDGDTLAIMGYFAIGPTQVVRDDLPGKMRRGSPQAVPGWLLGKLAPHVDLQGKESWGSRLLVAALEKIVAVADDGGGKVIVVDADNAGLLDFYLRHDFQSVTPERPSDGSLRLFMKVSTARTAIAQ